jgi:hypothetical protein
MSDKTKTKTKAELLEMLAEAVRNTQPQPVAHTHREPEQEIQPRKTRPAPKRTAKIKNVRKAVGVKQRGRR